MPLSIGDSINYLIDRLLNAPGVLYIAQSPVVTSMCIVFALMLIILFIFRDVDTESTEGESSLLVLTLCAGFYAFFFTTGALFLHNRVLGREIIDGNKDEFTAEIFGTGSDISDII